jgi:2-phospho-L-lactate guanylyltransferase
LIRALVPAKTLAEAKGRLADALNPDERSDLALAMLEDVLRTLNDARSVSDVSVVSPDSAVLELSARLGAQPIAESAKVRGINEALTHALRAMSPHPGALLVVLGDVPGISGAEIERLLAKLPPRGIAAAPSSDGGTSALAMRPAGVIPFQFGPDSFTAHRAAAARFQVEFERVDLPSLRLDVDTPADVRQLLTEGRDSATRRLLKRLGLENRLAAA